MNKPTAEEIVQRVQDRQKMIQSLFGSGPGKQVLTDWREEYVNGKLYHESDRTTVYAVAQRDFILMIEDIVKGEI